MKTDNDSNSPDTGRTSPAGRGNPKPPASESEFLSQQADEAKAAISQAVDDLRDHLLRGSDPRLWAKEHPLGTMGVAAVAGFAIAAGLIPTKEQQALKKLSEIEKALHPCPGDGPMPATEEQKKPGFAAGFVKHLMSAAGPAVMSALTAAISQAAHQAQQVSEEDEAEDQPPDQADVPPPPVREPPP